MREMTETEQFMRIITDQSLRDGFIALNTSTMPEFEADGWIKVYPIRYTAGGRPNTFALGE